MTLARARRSTRSIRQARTVELVRRHAAAFDRLVLATGSQPIRLPMPGMDLPGVMTFRDLADVDAWRGCGGTGARAVVIGGGLLGIEAAYGLARARACA